MELFNIDFKTLLELSTDESNIIISPDKGQFRLDKLNKSLNKINDRYSPTLRKLAE